MTYMPKAKTEGEEYTDLDSSSDEDESEEEKEEESSEDEKVAIQGKKRTAKNI